MTRSDDGYFAHSIVSVPLPGEGSAKSAMDLFGFTSATRRKPRVEKKRSKSIG